ncbi:MAG: MFS transporter [Miltoncostaeaceae bacterium]
MQANARNPLLRSRDGRAILVTQAAHALAQGMLTVIIPWLILEQGGSASQAAIGFAMTFVPFLLLAAPAGLAGDRMARRPLLGTALALGGALAVGIAVLMAAGDLSIPLLYLAAFAIGSVRVFVDAGMFGAVATVASRDEMMRAQAALAQAFNLGYFGGPAVAGLALVLGAGIAMSLVAGSLVVAAVAAVLASARLDERAPDGPKTSIRRGLGLLFLSRDLRVLTITGIAWSLASGAAISLAVPHLRNDLGVSGTALAAVLGAGVACMMLATPIITRLDRRHADETIIVLACAAYVVPALAMAMIPGVMGTALAYAPLMLANAICAATLMGARARRVPRSMQALAGVAGRTLVMAGLAGGAALGGLAADSIGSRGAYLLVGVALATTAVAARPALMRARDRRLRGRTAPARP